MQIEILDRRNINTAKRIDIGFINLVTSAIRTSLQMMSDYTWSIVIIGFISTGSISTDIMIIIVFTYSDVITKPGVLFNLILFNGGAAWSV